MCERWRFSFETFFLDMEPEWEVGLELDRKDNDKGYYKENCRWLTHAQNCRNTRRARLSQEQVFEIKRKIKEEAVTQTELAKEYGVSLGMINHIVKGRRWA